VNFDAFVAASERRGDTVLIRAGKDWLQGRTSYGGWASAVAYNVARRLGLERSGAMPPLRSAMISFVGPIWAEMEARPRVLRSGRTATWITVDLVCNDEVSLTATFLFMNPRESHVSVLNMPPPPVTHQPGELPRSVYGATPADFVKRFQTHPARLDYGGAPEVIQWVRYLDRDGLDGTSELLMIGDFSPPGCAASIKEVGGMCSLTWQLNLIGEVPDIGDRFWLVGTTSHDTRDGANTQLMQVWDPDGNPVAAGQQETAIFT